MTHEIPPDTLNSNINYCIDEYVRLVTLSAGRSNKTVYPADD